jgi:hypothetical protein
MDGCGQPGKPLTTQMCIHDCKAGSLPLIVVAVLCFYRASCAADAPLLAGSLFEIRYDKVRQKSSHNAFERKESLRAQLETHSIRSLEIDIHHTKSLFQAPLGDWFVYHSMFEFFGVLFSLASQCTLFSNCLTEISQFHATHDRHEVITVWIDVFDRVDPNQFAAAILKIFPSRDLWTPQDLLDSCVGATTLRDAIKTCGWPTLEQLRGKLIFVLTGNKVNDSVNFLHEYAQSRGDTRTPIAFVAPEIEHSEEIDSAPYAIFFNMSANHSSQALKLFQQGLVSRVFDVNTPGDWTSACQSHAHHLATDHIDATKHPWTSTSSLGEPFVAQSITCGLPPNNP